MSKLDELYAKVKETECNGCKKKIYDLVALYRNMICVTTEGELGRGYNIYILPNRRPIKDVHFVKWVPNLNHTCKNKKNEKATEHVDYDFSVGDHWVRSTNKSNTGTKDTGTGDRKKRDHRSGKDDHSS